jgi:hypothetical protein
MQISDFERFLADRAEVIEFAQWQHSKGESSSVRDVHDHADEFTARFSDKRAEDFARTLRAYLDLPDGMRAQRMAAAVAKWDAIWLEGMKTYYA